jgi:general secretion pathway protein D
MRASTHAGLALVALAQSTLAQSTLALSTLVLSTLALSAGHAAAQSGASPDPQVRAVIAPGAPAPPPAQSVPTAQIRPGDVTLNFPNVDVAVAAKAVLGDVLGVQYAVAPALHAQVSVVTQTPIARADVLRFFEAALSNAELALVRRDGVYAILPQAQALAQAPVTDGGDDRPGFASEAVTLSFVNADELKRLIDPVLPNVVVQADSSRNLLMVAGTPGQRAAARDLIRQFDVNWLRNTSFALFVPQRTDARLIVPELDKMINAPGSPARGLVKLIAMDRLNGILAVSTQPQYLDDVRRWIEIMDREGQNNERRIFVYRVQNGRSADLAKTLAAAFGAKSAGGSTDRGSSVSRDDLNLRPGEPGAQTGAPAPMTAPTTAPLGGPQTSGSGGSGLSAGDLQLPARASGTSVDISIDDLHAKISSDDGNNAIVVYATPRDYAVVEDALRKLDVTPSEVMIEAAIVEVTLTDQLAYGVQWSLASNHGNGGGGLTQGTSAAVAPSYPGFNYTIPLAKGVSATLDALENLTKIKVISSPKLMVLNNQTASLEVGEEVPILTGSAVSTVGSNAPIVNSIDYRDVGIILKITPRVNSSGLVLLDLAQEVSGVQQALTTSGVNSPTFSTRRIATSVAVQDGQTLALGGLFSSSRTDSKNGLPYLVRIPILGPVLFGNYQGDHERTELIVLLRPRLVRDVDDGQAVTEDLKAKLESLKPLWAERPQQP